MYDFFFFNFFLFGIANYCIRSVRKYCFNLFFFFFFFDWLILLNFTLLMIAFAVFYGGLVLRIEA